MSGGVAANGSNVQLYTPNGTKAQKWVAKKGSDGSLAICSAVNLDYVLSLDGTSAADQTNIQLGYSNDSAVQKFNLEAASAVVPDGIYTIASAKDKNMVLDVQWGSVESGGNIWIYKANGTKAQQWKVVNNLDGTISLFNEGSGCAIDLKWGGTTSGTNVWQYAGNETAAQKWLPISNGNGTVTLRSASNSGIALDICGGAAKSETNVQVYSRNGTAAQSFTFTAVQ